MGQRTAASRAGCGQTPGQIDGSYAVLWSSRKLGIGISGAQPFPLSAGYHINQCVGWAPRERFSGKLTSTCPDARRRGDRIAMFYAAVHESAFGTKRTLRD